MKSKIYLKNIQLSGKHGVNSYEKINNQLFQIDIEIIANLDKAFKTDKILHTIDYNKVLDEVEAVFKSKCFNLIESLAWKIGKNIFNMFNVISCRVNIRKPNILINSILDTVEVEVVVNE